MAKIEWKTNEEIKANEKQAPTELEEFKKNQELMQAALDGLLLGGGL
jgi:hypothetical protein